MKLPQIIVLELDGWLTKQLRELADESRWLIQQTRSIDTAMSLVRERRPAVLIVQIEPGEDKPEPLRMIAETYRTTHDVPVVAISDVKLPDAERAACTAALLDLGARFVLFPPLMKPVLEDIISGLMNASIHAIFGDTPPPPRRHEGIIDLAEEGADA
jgi:hypothetical protein